MNNILTWCEIPVVDIQRAKSFYSDVFGVSFIDETMDGFEMSMFESEPDEVSGALVKAPNYIPNKEATVVYLNGGDDLSGALQRAQGNGAEILIPKTAIKDGEGGYFAQFVDCEGNRVGLYSQA